MHVYFRQSLSPNFDRTKEIAVPEINVHARLFNTLEYLATQMAKRTEFRSTKSHLMEDWVSRLGL